MNPVNKNLEEISMFSAYKKFWTRYADFSGRSSRSDFWWVVLCNFLITLPFSLIAFSASSFHFLVKFIMRDCTIMNLIYLELWLALV